MKLIKQSIYSILVTIIFSVSAYSDCSYELFNISTTKNSKIVDFVNRFSDECEFSIIITDTLANKILQKRLNKTHIKNLTLDEVLEIVLKENNLSYTLKNNILKISYLQTKIFGIDYILSQREASGSTDVTLSSSSASSEGESSSSGADTGIKITSSDSVNFWEELDNEFLSILNRPEDAYKAQKPIINKNAGLVTVTATAKQMDRLEGYLAKLQDKVKLQVLIDVQLLTVTMSGSKSTGVDWKQLYALQNLEIATNYSNSKQDGTKSIAKAFTVSGGGKLSEVIKFLKTQGDVNSISNPKVLTLNNQPALITAGTEYFYKIQSATNQQGTSGGVAATTQSDEVKSVFAGVLLDITPEIADDKTITLKINPSLSETRQDLSQESSVGRSIPPDLNRRQLSSVVTVKDGNRIILGGLINTRHTMEGNKVPILGDIPIISPLFKYEEKVKQVEELVIIIEPHIINKEKNDLSLSDLGYEGIDSKTVKLKP